MKHVIIALVLLVGVSACAPLRFDKAPGQRLSVMPNEYLGAYKVKPGVSKTLDSLLVLVQQNEIKLINGSGEVSYTINRDISVSQFEDVLVLARPDEVVKSLYNLYILERKGSAIHVYFFNETLSKQNIPVVEQYANKARLNLDHGPIESPNANQHESLPVSQSGEPDGVDYYTVDEPNFTTFLKKDLSKLESIVLLKQKVTKR